MSKTVGKLKNQIFNKKFPHGKYLHNFIRRISDNNDKIEFPGGLFKTSKENGQSQPKIVIIGAGISGLSAADTLIKNGFTNILILEASERYGGRIYSVPIGDTICELGAKWLNVSDAPNSLFQLVKSSGILEANQEDYEKYYMTSKGEVLDGDFVQMAAWAFSSLISGVQYKNDFGQIQNSKAYIQTETEQIARKMFKNDIPTAKRVFTSLFRDLTSFVGCDLSGVSIAQLSKIANSYSNPISMSTGLGAITKRLASSIQNNQLLLGKPVNQIRWANLHPQENAYVSCFDGSQYVADHIICTLPLGTLKTFSSLLFVPRLPNEKTNVIKKLGVGYPGKIFLEYPRGIMSWFIGSIKPIWSITELDDRSDWGLDITEISLIPGSRNVLEVKIGGTAYADVEKCSDKIVVDKITQFLRRFLKNPNIPYPIQVLRSYWSTDACFLGGQSYLSIYNDEVEINELSLPLGRYKNSTTPVLLFAGDATICDGLGTLEGARQSGIREARRIIDYNLHILDQGME